MPSTQKARQRAREAGTAARPYVQRLIEDEELRANIQDAFEAARSAYARAMNGKGPSTRKVMEDKKLHRDLRSAAANLREASERLQERKRKRRWGRVLLIGLLGAALAIALSEDLRKGLLDRLFGPEEEFEYTSTTSADREPAAAEAS